MNKINIYIFEHNNNANNIIKLFNYSFQIIQSKSNKIDKSDLNIDSIIQFHLINPSIIIEKINLDEYYKDYLIWKIPYNTFKNITDQDICKDIEYYQELSFVSKLPKFTNIIILLEHNDLVNSNTDYLVQISYLENLTNSKILLCNMNITKAQIYLSLTHDKISNIDENTIDLVLREEFGKQIFKKLNTLEKKQKQIKILAEKEEIVNEWIESTGANKLVDLIELYIVGKYDQIINQHAHTELYTINQQINSINQIVNTYDNQTTESENQIDEQINIQTNPINWDLISKLIFTLDNILKITCYDINKLDFTDENYFHIYKDLDNIKKNLINYIEKLQISENLTEEQIDLYLKSSNTFINLIRYNEQESNVEDEHDYKRYQVIFHQKNKLIRKKLLLTFDEKIFNDMLDSKQIDMEFFKECIRCCLNYNPTNFINLIKFASTYSNEYINIIIQEFVLGCYNNTLIQTNLNNFIDSIQIILANLDIKNNTFPDTILLTQLIYKIVQIQTNFDNSQILITGYLFENYVGSTILYSNSNLNNFLHNICFNYKILLQNDYPNNKNLVEINLFASTNTFFSKIIKILIDSINLVNNQEKFDNESTNSVKKKITNKSIKQSDLNNSDNSESDDNSDDPESDDNSESDDDNIIIKTETIDKIYGFIKKSCNGKHLNQQTLKHISEIYYDKTLNYSKSIELYQKDVQNKTFTKLYKETKK